MPWVIVFKLVRIGETESKREIMNKFFIYMGAKSTELPQIKALLPEDLSGRVFEPFAGSATVAFELERESVLNDWNRDVMNLYEVIADSVRYTDLMGRLGYWYSLPATDLEREYYRCRQFLNAKNWSDSVGMAEAYLVIRQLCHRGMQRENSKGGFNVPFGHGRQFGTALNLGHHQFLSGQCTLMRGDFEPCIDLATSADWIFVDPPYWERQDYNGKGFSEEDHRRLAESLHRTEARWLLIHPDCDLYRELYMGYIIEEEDFRYNIHFGKRGTDRSHAQVKHLYIRNYQI